MSYQSLCRTVSCSLFIAVISLVFSAHAQQTTSSRQQRAQALQATLMDGVIKMQDKLKRDPDPVEIREITNGAVAALFSGNPQVAEKLLRLAYDQQDMHPGATFGEMPWNLGTRDVRDANAIDFATESLGPVLAGYSKQLSPAFRDYIRPHAAAALVALARQPILVSYSNIYVMNFTNTLLIAEYLHDDAMTQRGYQNLDAWLDYTGSSGIHEFDSPTYNAVVMNSLYMGYQHSASPDVREKYHHALDYLWTDLNANYFATGKKLAGAHSRDYNFLYGHNTIDDYYFIEGYPADLEPNVSTQCVFLLESTKEGGYRSPLKHFGPDTSRIITQRWDKDPQKYRYTYITSGFAMGVANGQYGPQDKMFAFDFTAPTSKKQNPLPSVFLATTTTGIPYGKDRTLDRSGHAKPKHLTNGLAAVQDKGFALLLSDADPKSDRNSTQFYVDMVMPSAGALTLNDAAVAASPKMSQPIHPGDVIGIRIGSTCFAMMPFAAAGSLISQSLVADEDGLSYGALRLSTTFRSATHNEQMPSAYLVFAQSCTGNGNSAATRLRTAKVKSTSMSHTWTVDASLNGTDLEIEYNPQNHTSVATKVNGVDFTTPPLHVLELAESVR